jgi:SET domain-containing protein
LEPTIPAAYLNHSCSPNCELLPLTKCSLGLMALCNIEPGTELTFDYQWEVFEWNPRCKCGAPNCRGWVVAKEQLKQMKKKAEKAERKKSK